MVAQPAVSEWRTHQSIRLNKEFTMRLIHRSAALAAVAFLGLASLGSSAVTAGGGKQTSVVYSSLVGNPLPGNLPSYGAEAYAFNEFGAQVTFEGTNRQLTNVVVTMSSWGCLTGHWHTGDCSTPAGATFSLPITFNVYEVNSGVLGGRIASVTQTFAIPYRPSASAKCDAGRWWDSSLKTCFNGKAVNVTFNLGGITVPDNVVYGIAYNTSHYGYSPVGSVGCPAGGCGYDSLNIALSENLTNVTVGETPENEVWQFSSIGALYCDSGTAGVNVFRSDAGCWGVDAPYTDLPYYVPAVQFKAAGGHS